MAGAMDHRFGSRRRVDIDVTVEIGSMRPATGRVRDASLSGVFIEMPAAEVRCEVPVRLTFLPPDAPWPKLCQWRGFVVRSTANGFGAMFDGEAKEDFEGMRALLRCATRSRPGDGG